MKTQSILTNTIIATGGRFANTLLGVVGIALLTRFLGPSSYGQYSLLLSFGIIIQLLADAGLYLTLAKEIARQPSASIFSQILSLRLVLLLAAFSVGLLIAGIVPSLRGLVLPLIIIFLGLSFQSISQLAMAVYQHQQVVWRATLGDLIGRLFQLGAILLFGLVISSVFNMAIAFSLGALAALIIHIFLLPQISWRFSFSWPTWRKIISQSWPLGAMLLVNAVYFRIDIVILSLVRTSAEVGLYALAYRLIESALFFPAMLGGLLLPRFSEALHRGKGQQLSQYLNESLRLVLLFLPLLLLILWLEGGYILSLVSGPEFADALPLLRILSLSLLFMFVGNIFGFVLVAYSKQKLLLKLYLFLTAFNLLTNLLFVPYWGAVAAASTTVITEMLSALVAGVVVYRLNQFDLPASFILPLLATFCLPLLVLVLPITLSPPLQFLTIISLYLFGLWSFKLLNRKQFKLLSFSGAPQN